VYNHPSNVKLLIEKCKTSKNIDEQIMILFDINSRLPESQQLRIPSLITGDYVHKAIATIEDSINPISVQAI
jgi:hypothetical protein